jgi:hypothetical protein
MFCSDEGACVRGLAELRRMVWEPPHTRTFIAAEQPGAIRPRGEYRGKQQRAVASESGRGLIGRSPA